MDSLLSHRWLVVGFLLAVIGASGCGDTGETADGTGGGADEELVTVPDVVGISGDEAAREIESVDLVATLDPEPTDPALCTVDDQDETGEVEAGTEVILTVSCLAEVPDVTGEEGQAAVETLEGEGFTVDFAEESGRDPSGCTVVTQDPEAEADAEAEILLELDCRQVDWENQEGDDWQAFAATYEVGRDRGCADVFLNYSLDGNLYTDDGDEVSDLDCPPADDPAAGNLPADVPDDPEADGATLGESDGCTALFEDVAFYGELHDGDGGYVDISICP